MYVYCIFVTSWMKSGNEAGLVHFWDFCDVFWNIRTMLKLPGQSWKSRTIGMYEKPQWVTTCYFCYMINMVTSLSNVCFGYFQKAMNVLTMSSVIAENLLPYASALFTCSW